MQQDRFHFRFCTAVFASWDFHLTDWQAAANLRLSLRQQLKEMLNDADAAEAQAARQSALRSIGRKVPNPPTLRRSDRNFCGRGPKICLCSGKLAPRVVQVLTMLRGLLPHLQCVRAIPHCPFLIHSYCVRRATSRHAE